MTFSRERREIGARSKGFRCGRKRDLRFPFHLPARSFLVPDCTAAFAKPLSQMSAGTGSVPHLASRPPPFPFRPVPSRLPYANTAKWNGPRTGYGPKARMHQRLNVSRRNRTKSSKVVGKSIAGVNRHGHFSRWTRARAPVSGSPHPPVARSSGVTSLVRVWVKRRVVFLSVALLTRVCDIYGFHESSIVELERAKKARRRTAVADNW